MRPLPLLFLCSILFQGCFTANKQKETAKSEKLESRTLEQRLTRPDSNLTYDMRQSSYSPRNGFYTKSTETKKFGFNQKVTPKTFGSKTFSGTKTAWMGDYVVSQKTVAVKEDRFANKSVPVKSVAVKGARESTKEMDVRPYADREKSIAVRGRSQDGIDSGENPGKYGGDGSSGTSGSSERHGSRVQVGTIENGSRWAGKLDEIKTINDVRELLNKN